MCTIEYPTCAVHPDDALAHVRSLCLAAKAPFTCGSTAVFQRQGPSELYCMRCNKDAKAKTLPDAALVALTLYGSITLLSLTVMFDFAEAQSAIQKIKQHIQEERDFLDQVAVVIGYISWDETEAQWATEMLRKRFLTLQESEAEVEQQRLRLDERTISLLHLVEMNWFKTMRLLNMCLRKVIAANE